MRAAASLHPRGFTSAGRGRYWNWMPLRSSPPARCARRPAHGGDRGSACAGCLGGGSAAPPRAALHPVGRAGAGGCDRAARSRSPTCSALARPPLRPAPRPTPTPARPPSSTRSTSCGCGSTRCPPSRSRSPTRASRRKAGAVTVSATLFARFGPAPYSAWVTLGPRTLRLTPGRGRWHVRADVSVVHRSDLAAYGVSWLHHPYFINGQRVTVVYAEAGRRRGRPADPGHGRVGHPGARRPLRRRRGGPAAGDLPGRQPQPGRAAGARRPRQGAHAGRVPVQLVRLHRPAAVAGAAERRAGVDGRSRADPRRHPADARRRAAQPARGDRDVRGGPATWSSTARRMPLDAHRRLLLPPRVPEPAHLGAARERLGPAERARDQRRLRGCARDDRT